jgi:hypothetical protein
MTKKEIIEELKKNIITVVFYKKDGTKRTMKCTLKNKDIKIENDEVQRVFDIKKNDWRSFRWNSVIMILLSRNDL